MAETVDYTPGTINFKDVRRRQRVTWGFGEVSTPDNLTGDTFELILSPGRSGQKRYELEKDDLLGLVHWTVPDDWSGPTMYLLLRNNEGWVQGQLGAADTQIIYPPVTP